VKVIAVWVVLVVAFVITYSALGSWAPDLSGGTPMLVIVGGIVAWFVGYVVWLLLTAKRFNLDNNRALAALATGEFRQPEAIYARWTRRFAPQLVKAMARHNYGWSMFRNGKLVEAVELLSANDTKIPNADLRTNSALDIALIRALLGELDTANEWLQEAEARTNMAVQPGMLGTLALVRAVIACREGRADEAVRLLEERWAEYESNTQGTVFRLLRVVRAFAYGASDTRNAGVAERKLEVLKPTYPTELSVLGTAWPEMATFVTAHQLD
jgi:hypothetical protein